MHSLTLIDSHSLKRIRLSLLMQTDLHLLKRIGLRSLRLTGWSLLILIHLHLPMQID